MMKQVVIIFLLLLVGGSAQAQEKCGIESCHGIDIVCGPKVPQVCTQMYALGDFCRQYARCEMVEGKCRLANDPTFDVCTSCVRKCMTIKDPVRAFNCEAQCRDKITPDTKPIKSQTSTDSEEGITVTSGTNGTGGNIAQEDSDIPCM